MYSEAIKFPHRDGPKYTKRLILDGDLVNVGHWNRLNGWLKTQSKELRMRAKVHFSKETIKELNMAGWVVQKDSPWSDAFNNYILRMDQALVQSKVTAGCVT